MRRLEEYLMACWPLNGHAKDVKGAVDCSWSASEAYAPNNMGRYGATLTGANNLTHDSVAFTSIAYTLNDIRYLYNGTDYFTNGKASASFTVCADATTIGTGATGTMRDVRPWSVAITADEAWQDYIQSLNPPSFSDVELPIPQP